MTTMTLARSQVLVTSIGILLLAVSAHIQIPLQPIPITLQTLAVMVIGLSFPKRAAMQAILAYLVLGFVGLPMFSGIFTWLRAGYLLGFIAAIWAMTSLRDHANPTFGGLFRLTLLGSLCIYGLGVPWLAAHIGLQQAILLGFMPFIIPGLVKGLLLAGIFKFLRS